MGGRLVSRRRRSVPPRADTSGGESQRSKSYRAGRAFRYRYRIAGPTFPVELTFRDAMEKSAEAMFADRLEAIQAPRDDDLYTDLEDPLLYNQDGVPQFDPRDDRALRESDLEEGS